MGRDEELAALGRLVDAARAGRGGTALLVGEAGIGKSRLAREMCALASGQGLRTLVGRAVQEGRATPYRAVSEAIFSAVRGSSPPSAPQLEPFMPALGRMVPDWRAAGEPGEESSVIVGEAVLRLLRLLGGQSGCLLVLEDLQWADPDTLSVVEYLVDNVGSEPIGCVATIRSDEPSPALALVATLQSRRSAEVLELTRLPDEEVEEMAKASVGEAVPGKVLEALQVRSEGVPLLVEEMLSDARLLSSAQAPAAPLAPGAVPLSFAETIRRRLGTLGPRSRAVTHAAAVLGRAFDWSLLPAVTGTDQEATLEALHEAVRAQLIEPQPPGAGHEFRFRHALIRDAVLNELLPPERAQLARRAAEVVEQVAEADAEEAGGGHVLAAELRLSAGDHLAAARHLLVAGRRALRRGALSTAEATLRRARRLVAGDEDVTLDVEDALTETLALAAKTDDALELGEALLGSLERVGAPPGRRAELHLTLARAADAATRWPLARHHLAGARRQAELSAHQDLLARVDALAAHVAMGEERLEEAVELATSSLRSAERLGLPEVACEALEVIGRRERVLDLRRAEATFRRELDTAERHGLRLWWVRALHELGTIDMFTTSNPDRLVQARDLAYQSGALSLGATVDLQLVGLHGFLFEPEPAIEAGRRCVELARSLGLDLVHVMGLAQTAFAHAIAGQRDEMEDAIAGALGQAGERADVMALVWGHARATYSLLSEDRGAALEELETAMQWVRRSAGSTPGVFPALWALVKTVMDDGGEEARREVRGLDLAAVPINQALLGVADAVSTGREGRREEAYQGLVDAGQILTVKQMQGMRNLAYRIAAEAALEDGWGEPVEWLTEAASFFERTGHHKVATACRSLLRTAGVVPTRRTDSEDVPPQLRPFALSERELEVLGLVAERLPNREIAERLYISVRTVEKHVERLLAKTGTASRSELGGLARRTGASGAVGRR